MKLLSFDLETSGSLPEYALQPWRVAQKKAYISSFAYCRRKDQRLHFGAAISPDLRRLRPFLEYAIKHNYRIVGWNVTFDIAWLLAYGLADLVFRVKWLDGMRLWRHYFLEPEYDMTRQKKKSYGLKECVKEILPVMADYEAGIDFHDTSQKARVKLLEYNRQDVIAGLLCSEHWWGLLTPKQQTCALIEAASIPFIAQANLAGMVVDTFAAHELQASLDATAAQMLKKLAPHGVTEKVIRSPVQLSKLMYDDWGLPVYKENTSKKTGKISRSTDKEVLHELAFCDPRARDLRAYREALGNRTKFADAPLASVAYNEDDCTHPEAILFGTYSGRLTYSSNQGKGTQKRQTGFALHQEKRGKEFRRIILAPEGYELVEFDASGQEFRWMAIASGDPVMLQLCEPNEDPHSYMGAEIAGCDYRDLMARVQAEDPSAKLSRQLGKVANFSLQYRTSARKLRTVARVDYNIPMELPQAQQIRATYLRVYRRIPVYWEQQIRQTKTLGYVETFAGRRVQVVGEWETMGWSMGSTAINYRIQGTGADQKYLALAALAQYLTDHGIKFAWDLHDGLYFYVPTRKVSRAAVEMKHILDNLPYEKAWGFKPLVPFPWDCKTGPAWGLLKGWSYAT